MGRTGEFAAGTELGVERVHWKNLPVPGQQTRSRAEMAELKHSISTQGVTTPIELSSDGEDIVDGHHRVRIARALRLTDVPVRRN